MRPLLQHVADLYMKFQGQHRSDEFSVEFQTTKGPSERVSNLEDMGYIKDDTISVVQWSFLKDAQGQLKDICSFKNPIGPDNEEARNKLAQVEPAIVQWIADQWIESVLVNIEECMAKGVELGVSPRAPDPEEYLPAPSIKGILSMATQYGRDPGPTFPAKQVDLSELDVTGYDAAFELKGSVFLVKHGLGGETEESDRSLDLFLDGRVFSLIRGTKLSGIPSSLCPDGDVRGATRLLTILARSVEKSGNTLLNPARGLRDEQSDRSMFLSRWLAFENFCLPAWRSYNPDDVPAVSSTPDPVSTEEDIHVYHQILDQFCR